MFQKQNRVVNRSLLDSFHEKKCLVCGVPSCDPAHVKSRGARGDDVPENVMPLCRVHHDEQGHGIVTFVLKYPKVLEYLQLRGWEVIEIFGQKKLLRTGKITATKQTNKEKYMSLRQKELAYKIAQSYLGVKEKPGKVEEQQILDFHLATTLKAESDEVAWCSAFMNWCWLVAAFFINPMAIKKVLLQRGMTEEQILKFYEAAKAYYYDQFKNFDVAYATPFHSIDTGTGERVICPTLSAGAISWEKFGEETKSPAEGDLVLFKRGGEAWMRHIAFYQAKEKTAVKVLGGNQSNSVCSANYKAADVVKYITVI